MPGLLKRWKQKILNRTKETGAADAYNLWAGGYDNQPDNLMLQLDEVVFSALLANVTFDGGIIADVGCGTGRHWQKLTTLHPEKIIGFDVSEQMLAKLAQKFPDVQTCLIKNELLPQLVNDSCSLLISTLTIAHIENAAGAVKEWARVTRPGGFIIITDYHPAALAKGAKRTFTHNEAVISIKNYVHTVEVLTNLSKQLNLAVIRLTEKAIDSTMKPLYEKQGAEKLYYEWEGTPVIYGLLLQKANASL